MAFAAAGAAPILLPGAEAAIIGGVGVGKP